MTTESTPQQPNETNIDIYQHAKRIGIVLGEFAAHDINLTTAAEKIQAEIDVIEKAVTALIAATKKSREEVEDAQRQLSDEVALVHKLESQLQSQSAEISNLRTQLDAWHSQFNTSQLSHTVGEREYLKKANQLKAYEIGDLRAKLKEAEADRAKALKALSNIHALGFRADISNHTTFQLIFEELKPFLPFQSIQPHEEGKTPNQ